jgi:hypothetical protein
MLIRAGFPEPIAKKKIDLGRLLGKTNQDFFYSDPMECLEGICIYLDGLSRNIHGDPRRQAIDQEICKL